MFGPERKTSVIILSILQTNVCSNDTFFCPKSVFFDANLKIESKKQIRKFIYKERTESFFAFVEGLPIFFLLRMLTMMSNFLQPRMVIMMLNSHVYNNHYSTSYRECDSKRRKFKGSFASYDFLAQTVQTVRENKNTKGCHHFKQCKKDTRTRQHWLI